MTRFIDNTPCQFPFFSELDDKLTRLEAEGASSVELWRAFEGLLLVPSPSEANTGRRCWWQHLYAILERHGLGVARGATWG